MTQLLMLLLTLVLPTLMLMLAGQYLPGMKLNRETSARVGLTVLLVLTSSGHFAQTEGMASMLPGWVPYRTELILITGVLELLGAVGLWLPGLTRTTGTCLILMFLGFLPINIYAAMNRIDFGGHGIGPLYLLARVPFQLLLIGWTYWATEQRWHLHKPAASTDPQEGSEQRVRLVAKPAS